MFVVRHGRSNPDSTPDQAVRRIGYIPAIGIRGHTGKLPNITVKAAGLEYPARLKIQVLEYPK